MRRTIRYLAMGLALLLPATGGTLHAQVNPATVKNQAQNGVNQAQQTHPPAQGQTQAQTKTKPKTAATNNAAAPKQQSAPQKTTPPKTAQATHPAPAGPQANPTHPKTTAKTPAKTQAPPTTATRATPPPVRRDPFVTLLGRRQGGPEGEPVRLPPGKAGLQVNTLVIQGIVSSPTGMIAVVANPQRSVYFLHVGDELFDGKVDRIEIDGVTFHEVGKDAFGKPLEREVTRKLNPSLGEQP